MTRIVLDASATIAFVIDDECSTSVRSLFLGFQPGDEFIVPVLWRHEVANGLAMGVRRGRISIQDMGAALDTLAEFPVATDEESLDQAWQGTVRIARRRNLPLYDAAYLELALRAGTALATLDRQLAEAALAEGVKIAI